MKKLARVFTPISLFIFGMTLRQCGFEITDPKAWVLCICMLITSASIAIELSE